MLNDRRVQLSILAGKQMQSAATPPYSPSEILLVGDSLFLLELVAANLAPLTAETLLLGNMQQYTPTYAHQDGNNAALPRLVVLALSHSDSEPVVILDQVGLTGLVGTVPLLIISDRPFRAGLERRIFHMPFPFRAHTFRQIVDIVLQDAVPHDPGASSPYSPQRSS
jgi:hypothetical protein